ncbi:MAG: amidohydrolase [Collinsella sp.]|nr:amidohydrolase [Collinsella sp.]
MGIDRILLSNAVFTGNSLMPFPGGVAISGNKIVGVGSKEDMVALGSDTTEIEDFGDRLIMPGFNDSHLHFASGSAMDDPDFCVNLMDCRSEAECAEKVRAFCERHPDREWVYGLGWDTAMWEDHTPPTKASLDAFSPDQAICLSSFDHHAVWSNSAALDRVGIDADTPQPEGGEIVHDDAGEPTGLLLGQPASMKVSIPALYVDGLDKSIARLLGIFKSLGITAVGDMFPRDLSNEDIYEIYKNIEDRGELTCRVTVFPSLFEIADALKLRNALCSDRLRIGGVKQVLDGVIEAHTAFMLEPYEGGDFRGETNLPKDQFIDLVCQADASGLPVRVHCIGDAAARLALDAHERAQKLNGKKGLHHCLEHIETIADEDIERMARLDISGCVQPLHATFGSSTGFYNACIGDERASRCWRFRNILDEGVRLGISTDFPAAPLLDPLQVVYASVSRCMPDGSPSEGFHKEYALTLGETLQCMTQGSAWVESFETKIGTLEPGKLADIVVLDRDLFKVEDVHEIAESSVILTMMDGEVIYRV